LTLFHTVFPRSNNTVYNAELLITASFFGLGPELGLRLAGNTVQDAFSCIDSRAGYNPAVPLYYRLTDFRYPDKPERLYPTDPNPSHPDRPWHLEVGFGDGRFWAAHHALEPDTNYLGVEISGVSVLKARDRYRKVGLQHAILTRLSAEFVVRNIIPARSLNRVYVNFPDPWPKARHEDARLLRPDFLELLSTRLAPDGEVWLTTDHAGYYQFALESAAGTGLYHLTQPSPPAAALETKYALKWRDLHMPIHHARLQKRTESQRIFPPLEVHPMPHAVLHGTLPTNPLEKTVVKSQHHTVILLEQYANPDRLIVLARVEEQNLIQEVLISASHRDSGEVVVGLESFGGPLITAGVKAAVGAVTDWLAQNMTVIRKSY
jgi:tRNA (guanine-N7-)-methyltransferase